MLHCPWDFPHKNTGWVAISFSRESSWPMDGTPSPALAGGFFIAKSLGNSPLDIGLSHKFNCQQWVQFWNLHRKIFIFYHWWLLKLSIYYHYPSCCSVAKSCPTLCNPIDCCMPGLPVFHCLLGFAQTHVHWVDDAIQPSYPLLTPSPPALNLSQHQGKSCVCFAFPVSQLFVSVVQSIDGSASVSVLPMNIQDWFPLGLTG